MSILETSLVQRAVARSQVYAQLALGFLPPDGLQVGRFAGAIRRSVSLLGSDALKKALEALEANADSCSPQELELEYNNLFVNGQPLLCPPYETEYGMSHVFAKVHQMADVSGFYAAFGLRTSQAMNERPDHVSSELEFMHFLAFKEAYARERGLADKADLLVDAERKFVEDHLGKWLTTLCSIIHQTSSSAFYRALAVFTKEFFEYEFGSFKIHPEPSGKPDRSLPNEFQCPATCPALEER